MNQQRELKNMTHEELKALPVEGYKTVTFTKKTGEVAIRKVTRDNNIIPVFQPKTSQTRVQTDKTVRAWDGDNLKFVSIIPENVISVT
jgi:predicted polyphosphate/ATP-dependent NAD kinase